MERKRLLRAAVYTVGVLVVGVLLNLWAVLGYVDHVNSERDQAERRAAARQTAQAEQTRQLVCRLALGYGDYFRDNPPPPGREQIRDTWAALAVQFRCT